MSRWCRDGTGTNTQTHKHTTLPNYHPYMYISIHSEVQRVMRYHDQR